MATDRRRFSRRCSSKASIQQWGLSRARTRSWRERPIHNGLPKHMNHSHGHRSARRSMTGAKRHRQRQIRARVEMKRLRQVKPSAPLYAIHLEPCNITLKVSFLFLLMYTLRLTNHLIHIRRSLSEELRFLITFHKWSFQILHDWSLNLSGIASVVFVDLCWSVFFFDYVMSG